MFDPKSPIENHMTAKVFTVGAEQSLKVAHDMMIEHGVRHLPVLHGGKLVGIVSDRDLNLIETLSDVDPAKVKIEEAMTAEPHIVDPQDAICDVAADMAKDKHGAAVIAKGTKVLGVFTTIDALHLIASAAD